MSNHYRTLGVDPQADPVVIRSAYLALIRRYHPDKAGDEADSAQAQAVTAAWEVLRDPERRAAYDESRRARFSPGEGRGGGLVVAGGPRVRGGAAGRNLFLLLAAGTLGLGWWALQQPQPGPLPRITAEEGTARSVPAQPDIRPVEDERAVRSRLAASDQPRLPAVVRQDPDVDAAIEAPPLPVAERVRMPVRVAEAPVPRPRAVTSVAARAPSPPPSVSSVDSPVVVASAAAAVPAPAPAKVDLAPLERHLQLLTDQSFRFGTPAKKARVMASREGFLTRLRTCDNDACKRDAYLRRNAEIGEIMRN